MNALEGTDRAGRYAWAGWLAIASGVLLIPEVVLAVGLGVISPGLRVLATPIHVANLVIGIYVLIMFRDLLNRVFAFHDVDRLVSVMVVANVVFFLLGMFEFLMGLGAGSGAALERAMTVMTLGLFVIYCLISICFAVVLLRLSNDLFGFLKPYAYLTIAAGVCGMTILLSPIGMLLAAGGLVVQGMVFLNAKREMEIL